MDCRPLIQHLFGDKGTFQDQNIIITRRGLIRLLESRKELLTKSAMDLFFVHPVYEQGFGIAVQKAIFTISGFSTYFDIHGQFEGTLQIVACKGSNPLVGECIKQIKTNGEISLYYNEIFKYPNIICHSMSLAKAADVILRSKEVSDYINELTGIISEEKENQNKIKGLFNI